MWENKIREMDFEHEFENIYLMHWKKIYNYVYGRILRHDDAEELTADIFVTVWQNFERYDETRGKMSTWLGTIACRKVDDYFRSAYRRKETPVSDFPETQGYEEHYFENANGFSKLENEQVIFLLAQLSAEERNFLELRYALEMDNGEVAELLGITTNAVSHRYARLLDKCRKIFEKK